jgi:hypothetical protein
VRLIRHCLAQGRLIPIWELYSEPCSARRTEQGGRLIHEPIDSILKFRRRPPRGLSAPRSDQGSAITAFEHLKNRLQSEPRDEAWVLLTNLAFSVTHQLQSDEIDLVAIGS